MLLTSPVLASYAAALRWIFAHYSGGAATPLPRAGWVSFCEALGLAGYLSLERLEEVFEEAMEGDQVGRRRGTCISFDEFFAALELSAAAVTEKVWAVCFPTLPTPTPPHHRQPHIARAGGLARRLLPSRLPSG